MGSVLKLAAIATVLFWLCSTATSAPNTNIKQVLCNGATYSKSDPFATSLAYVLQELEDDTSTRKGFDFYNISPYPNGFAYGHGSCGNNLSSSDCNTCMVAAKQALVGSCVSRIGGRLVLFDCGMRYEQYPFTD